MSPGARVSWFYELGQTLCFCIKVHHCHMESWHPLPLGSASRMRGLWLQGVQEVPGRAGCSGSKAGTWAGATASPEAQGCGEDTVLISTSCQLDPTISHSLYCRYPGLDHCHCSPGPHLPTYNPFPPNSQRDLVKSKPLLGPLCSKPFNGSHLTQCQGQSAPIISKPHEIDLWPHYLLLLPTHAPPATRGPCWLLNTSSISVPQGLCTGDSLRLKCWVFQNAKWVCPLFPLGLCSYIAFSLRPVPLFYLK